MSGTKFFIHGGGMWREVDENNGRVTGWGKIQFVYLSRGRLVVARRNSVLKGLKALLAGKATTVRDGPRLQILRPKKRDKKALKIKQNESNHCNCCTCQHAFHHSHQLASDILFNSLLKQNTVSTATQCALTAGDSVKVVQVPHIAEKKICKEVKDHIGAKLLTGNKVPLKELTIDEDDVILVRTFIEHDERNIFNISLMDYDADDSCKRSVFYKINPLVVVERSSRIAQMIRPPSQCSSVSLKEFITHLGLQSVHEVSKRSKYKMRQRKSQQSLNDNEPNDSDTDKENIILSTRRSTNVQESKLKKKSLHTRKFSGVKKNSLLNMTHRFRSAKNIKVNKNEAANTEAHHSKQNSHENIILQKTHRMSADKKLVTNVRKRNASVEISSDSESLASNKEKQNIPNMPQNLHLTNSKRSTAEKNSLSKKESKNISTIDNIKESKQLSQSLQTSSKKNELTVLPFESSSDDEAFQKDSISEKSRLKHGNTSGKQQKIKSKGGNEQKTTVLSNSTSKGTRAYSRAEDEAIVSWLKTGDRANLVNGNRIWKELKPIHYQTTGHSRPWQSLRNRYLRYVLPALGSLAVPPALAQRLRAAAAQGEIKLKNNSKSADNSIFKSARAPVRSAWAARPKSAVRSPPSPPSSPSPPASRSSTPSPVTIKSLRSRMEMPPASTSKSTHQSDKSESDRHNTSGTSKTQSKRTLRSSAAHSPPSPIPKVTNRRDSLTYSELTRRFAARHRSTPQSDSPLDTRAEKRLHETSDSADSSDNSDDDTKTKRVTRNDSKISPSIISGSTSRRSKRFRGRSRTPERSRTRRLYNPRAL